MKSIIKKEIKKFKDIVLHYFSFGFYNIKNNDSVKVDSKEIIYIPAVSHISNNDFLNYSVVEFLYKIANNHIILYKNITSLEEQGIILGDDDYIFPDYENVYGVLVNDSEEEIYLYVRSLNDALCLVEKINNSNCQIEWLIENYNVKIIVLEKELDINYEDETIKLFEKDKALFLKKFRQGNCLVYNLNNYLNKLKINKVNTENQNIAIIYYNEFLREILSPSDYGYFQNTIISIQEYVTKIFSGSIDINIEKEFIESYENDLLEEIINVVFETNHLNPYDFDINSIRENDFYNYLMDSQINSKTINEKIEAIALIWKTIFNDSIQNYNYNWIKSIYTSEWMFKNIQFLPLLDNTMIVTGFLKSIEQLLYFILKTYYNDIKIEKNGKIYGIEDEIIENNFMLRFAFNFIKDKELIVDKNMSKVLLEKLDVWIKHSRNGFLHKDLIEQYSLISEIRKTTYEIVLLILLFFEIN